MHNSSSKRPPRCPSNQHFFVGLSTAGLLDEFSTLIQGCRIIGACLAIAAICCIYNIHGALLESLKVISIEWGKHPAGKIRCGRWLEGAIQKQVTLQLPLRLHPRCLRRKGNRIVPCKCTTWATRSSYANTSGRRRCRGDKDAAIVPQTIGNSPGESLGILWQEEESIHWSYPRNIANTDP